jgi:hypothetical protein
VRQEPGRNKGDEQSKLMVKRDKPITLQPLSPTLYRMWADNAKSKLTIHKVFGSIDGSDPDPTPNNVNSDDSNDPAYLALYARAHLGLNVFEFPRF